MFGAIEFEDFDVVKPPQDVATAMSDTEGWTGSSFKMIKFMGRQPCKGTNYWFIAEETTTGNPASKKFVSLAINGYGGHYAIIPSSIHEVKFEI